MNEIRGALAAEAAHMELGWSILWKTRANIKRIGCVIGVNVLCLWCGQGVISYYFSPILTQVGITGTDRQTGINGGMQIWNFLVSIAGAILADRLGRRTLWMISMVAMILANIGTTVSSAVVDYDASNEVASAFVIVFLFLYNVSHSDRPLIWFILSLLTSGSPIRPGSMLLATHSRMLILPSFYPTPFEPKVSAS